ncbi:MAG: hypothetical protein COV76_05270 [Candidatus Omnitrophica bacterium CG11_big_fil_rev_8_21_14_0_20_64_10]|nr:MAG: hypothetical protein COV76_05270 [Candidatus Omnitrophica bacterium CG11_big_fil_rev_8_21_14_0_20_64_10]
MKRRLWIGVVALGLLAVAGVTFGLRSYQVFTRQEPVAFLRCERAPGTPPGQFTLLFTQSAGPLEDLAPVAYRMTGDQWMIEGDFLKFHPWLNWAGIENRHKLTRLTSRYYSAKDERERPRTVHELNSGSGPVWRWLHEQGRWLPAVQAVYGSGSYTTARPGGRWTVYVTLSGYLVEPSN